ncbi:T9SS type A sorting domain-containing protein [Sporocytophaga myxococcoides]|uniref:NHL domain-containing protein n=1 Tax=Sporocytophaga myxococcoides TaxID=153721 RepID=UPI00041983A8|nr:T9SS type A sorting domain-containing protein [Sporocytophaga myxococcoides]
MIKINSVQKLKVIFALLLLLQVKVKGQVITLDNQVTTFSGTGLSGYTDGPKSIAQFFDPMGLAFDQKGNLYVADNINRSIIRKVTPDGVVSTYAGNGVQGFANGNLSVAKFSQPTDLIFSTDGIAYVADNGNHQIRKISTSGNVTTFAGSLDYGNVDGVGGSAKFNQPYSAVFDKNGNLFVTDEFNHQIRKITPQGLVTVFAGNGVAGFADGTGTAASFNMPMGIDIDAQGNLYVADYLNSRIRKVTPQGVVTTVAGTGEEGFANGSAATAKFDRPSGLTLDASGNIYVADCYNYRVRKISPDGIVSTFAGNGTSAYTDGLSGKSSFRSVSDVEFGPDGALYVSDNSCIRKIAPVSFKAFSSVQNYPSTNQSIAISATSLTGNLNILASDGYEVSLSSTSGFASSLNLTATNGSIISVEIFIRISNTAKPGTNNGTISITSSGAQDVILNFTGETIPNTASPTIMKGIYVSTIASGLKPVGVVADSDGNLFVADGSNHVIKKISKDGTITVLAGAGTSGFADGKGIEAKFSYPSGIAIAKNGDLYITDSNNHRIRKVTQDGEVSTIAGTGTSGSLEGAAASAQFYNPSGIAIDIYGNIFVADKNNSKIRKISTDLIVSTVGATSFNYPSGVAADLNGNIYVADQSNQKIKKITADGTISIIAGTSAGYLDGNALSSKFNYPSALTVDAEGNIYVSDMNNYMIRKILPTGVVVTLGGSASSSGSVDGVGTSAVFSSPQGLTTDLKGNVYVADVGSGKIRKLSAYQMPGLYGIQGSPSAKVDFPVIAAALTNNLVVTGTANLEVSSYVSFLNSLSIIPTNGTANFTLSIRTKSTAPVGAIFDTIIVSSLGAEILRIPVEAYVSPMKSVIHFDPIVSTLAGTATSGLQDGKGVDARFNTPYGLALDKNDNLFVADYTNHRIRKITPDGEVTTYAGTGTKGAANGPVATATFNNPQGLVFDAAGNLYVSEYGNNVIRKITPDGIVSTFVGGSFSGNADGTGSQALFYNPSMMAIDVSGIIYLCDVGNNKIRKISPEGVVTSLPFYFKNPKGIALDDAGNIYVVDNNYHQIVKITPNNEYSVFAGGGTSGADGVGSSAGFYYPSGITRGKDGNFYIADGLDYKIRQMTPARIVTTIAGTGTSGTADGLGSSATFSATNALVVGSNGNIYISEYNNIRKISKPSLSPFQAEYGSVSPSQSFNVKGFNLTESMTITAPAGFELSFSATTGYSNSLSLAPVSGNIASKRIYIRLAATANASSYNDKVVISASTAEFKTLDVQGTVTGVVSSVKNADENEFAVYPNPVQSLLHIIPNTGKSETLSVKLLNMQGIEVLSTEKSGAAAFEMDFSSLPAGIYLLELNDGTGAVQHKIIK